MKCFEKSCDKQGTVIDYETPAMFENPENPNGPTMRPIHCDEHHSDLIRRRNENEAPWRTFDDKLGLFK
jgi:hypothetical protein